MAIKDKDGKVYTLRGPNPFMQTQAEWDRNQIIFHNFGWRSEIVHDERNPVEEFNKTVVDIGKELDLKSNNGFVNAKEFIEEIRQKPFEEPKPEPKSEPKPEEPVRSNVVTINVDERAARLLKDRGVQYFCVPVIDQKVHKDSLYDSTYTTPVYGDKMAFDAIIVDQSDFQLQLWCMKIIPKGSVIYQMAKGGEWERRWWKVENYEPKTGGYILLASISDSNPDFS